MWWVLGQVSKRSSMSTPSLVTHKCCLLRSGMFLILRYDLGSDCFCWLQSHTLGAEQRQFDMERVALRDALTELAPGFGAGIFLEKAISRRSQQVWTLEEVADVDCWPTEQGLSEFGQCLFWFNWSKLAYSWLTWIKISLSHWSIRNTAIEIVTFYPKLCHSQGTIFWSSCSLKQCIFVNIQVVEDHLKEPCGANWNSPVCDRDNYLGSVL